MANIVSHKPHNVTIGVLDKSVQLYENLQSVTFTDRNGTAHTVNAHVDGPFDSPEAIVAAFENGVLHVFASHDAAIAHWADQGDHEFVERLEAFVKRNNPEHPEQEGGDQ
jgi:hypothetical protein